MVITIIYYNYCNVATFEGIALKSTKQGRLTRRPCYDTWTD